MGNTCNVFSDKNVLVQYLYNKLNYPSQIKIQKLLYLLYAFYGAAYGKYFEENSEIQENYCLKLFESNFEAWRYGPLDPDVYTSFKRGEYTKYSNKEAFVDLNTELTMEHTEKKNIINFIDNMIRQADKLDDFTLVDRTHQDECWSSKYTEGEMHTKMNNEEIVREYMRRYIKK